MPTLSKLRQEDSRYSAKRTIALIEQCLLMLNVLKVRIYPNQEQQIALAKNFGCCRFVWNYYLHKTEAQYKETGKGLSYCDMAKDLNQLKKAADYSWLKETDDLNQPASGKISGIDLGLNSLVTVFDGESCYKVDPIKPTRKYAKRLKHRQQSKAAVKVAIEEILDQLPESYPTDAYQRKCEEVYQHVYESYSGAGRSIYNAAA